MSLRNLRGALLVASFSVVAAANANMLYTQNFDGVTDLNAPVDEAAAGFVGGTWTTSPMTGGLEHWSFSKSITGGGVTEWNGWSVAKKDWWVSVAGDQQRSQFTKSSGNALIADPDEFDDKAPGITNAGYNVFAVSNKIKIADVISPNIQVKFDSSWRPEGFDDDDNTNNQTARVRYRVDGGAWVQALLWDSQAFGANFKPDATNESVSLDLAINGQTGQNVELEFALINANNDWWWAVDNLEVSATEIVPEPATMVALGIGALMVARRRRSK